MRSRTLYLLSLAIASSALLAAAGVLPALAIGAPAPTPFRTELGLVSIASFGPERLARIEAEPELDWWVELDQTLVVSAAPAVLDRLGREVKLTRRPLVPGGGPLLFVLHGRADARLSFIASGGRYSLAQLVDPATAVELEPLPADSGACAPPAPDPALRTRWYRFAPDVVLARSGANLPAPAGDDAPLADPTLVDRVDVDRWFAAIETLAGWNRWTRGSEILLARDWLVAQLAELPHMTVTTESFPVTYSTGWNVLAALPGLGGSDRFVIVGGHYDAVSESSSTAAPGAEDNASGCAGVLELARIFAYQRPLESLLFVCYAGEEQGLYGSEFHAQNVVGAGLDDNVDLMLNMDMIGYTEDADLDVLIETDSAHSALLTIAVAAAAAHTTLTTVTSIGNCWCSDHAPFLGLGMPGLMTIENDYWAYPYYHTTLDLPNQITPAMGENILRMNVAVVAEVAGMPIFTGDFEIGDLQFWSLVVN